MFTIQQVYIGEKVLDQLTDEEGIKWYPLKSFLTRILCKYDKVSSFRDSAISRYMKVFEYNPNRPGAYRNIKMWFINENGVKYLLRHMEIRRVDNKHIYSSREKGFYEACLFFNVKTPNELDPLYINTPPNLKDYDIWSVMCIENDLKIQIGGKNVMSVAITIQIELDTLERRRPKIVNVYSAKVKILNAKIKSYNSYTKMMVLTCFIKCH